MNLIFFSDSLTVSLPSSSKLLEENFVDLQKTGKN